jgi:RIO kinase 1
LARRLEKRKRPPRDVKQLKEQLKITAGVLDDPTLDVLVHFFNNKTLRSLDYPVAQGKESTVFRGTTPDGANLAVKIYKYEASSFRAMARYIEGDPRFAKARRALRPLVKQWAKKEFANLAACAKAGVRAPRPVAHRDNVVVMEFLGEGGLPYAKLQDVVLADPERTLDQILEDVRRLYRAGLVHGDLSPYNIVFARGEPYFIDVSQSVLLQHPRAREFLEHDVQTLLKHFAKLGARRDFAATLAWVTGGSAPGKTP